jgi:hypothetical protein
MYAPVATRLQIYAVPVNSDTDVLQSGAGVHTAQGMGRRRQERALADCERRTRLSRSANYHAGGTKRAFINSGITQKWPSRFKPTVSGDKRTSLLKARSSAFDPNRTFSLSPDAVQSGRPASCSVLIHDSAVDSLRFWRRTKAGSMRAWGWVCSNCRIISRASSIRPRSTSATAAAR